ncbi:hypothetical protein HDU92_001817, partial [Lobulomyces angularis]
MDGTDSNVTSIDVDEFKNCELHTNLPDQIDANYSQKTDPEDTLITLHSGLDMSPDSTMETVSSPVSPVEEPINFTKRTSSLKTDENSNLYKKQHSSEKKSGWGSLFTNSFLKSSKIGMQQQSDSEAEEGEDDDEFSEESYKRRSAKNRKSVLDMNMLLQKQEHLLVELDNASHKLTLEALERENHKLSMNPKTILAEAGAYRTATETLHAITEGSVLPQSNDDIEFWNSIMNDYSSILHKIPQLLHTKVRAGIPTELRPKIWMIMCDAQPERMKLLYPNLVKEDSPFDRIIKRDLPRTFPKIEMFKDVNGEGQKQLYNILKAYSIYDSEVGYCQGLSFVVGPLLMQKVSEIDTFSILVRLMEESEQKFNSNPNKPNGKQFRPYALRSLFTPQMVGLHLMLFQHTALVKKLLPELYQHFNAHNINPTMYASQWFLTIFAYNFPFPLVFRIFDIIFSEGAILTILKFSISLLKKNLQNLLEKLEFEDILNFLKGDILFLSYNGDHEKAVKDAMSLDSVINEEVLSKLKR